MSDERKVNLEEAFGILVADCLRQEPFPMEIVVIGSADHFADNMRTMANNRGWDLDFQITSSKPQEIKIEGQVSILQKFETIFKVDGWFVEIYESKTDDENWTVGTVDIDANGDGKPVNFGGPIFEGICPIVEKESEIEQLCRTFEMIPDLLRIAAKEADKDKKSAAFRVLYYILTGQLAD